MHGLFPSLGPQLLPNLLPKLKKSLNGIGMENDHYPTPPQKIIKSSDPNWAIIGTFWIGVVGVVVTVLIAIATSPKSQERLQNSDNGGKAGVAAAKTNEQTRISQKAVDNNSGEFQPQNGISHADFSNPAIECSNMSITPTFSFFYNDRFPGKFGGTWRIIAPGGGFTGTFTVPTAGRYNLVVTHGSSYNDSLHQPGYSPVTIQVNSETVVQGYNPAEHHPGFPGMPTDRWPIFAHAGQNTLQWTYEAHGTTHYWIHSIVIQSE
jgi:hypothetical protein